MSTFNPFHNTPPIYEAVRHWVNRSLLGNGSCLSNAADLWTLENLDELDRYYVQNLDEGEGDFLSKLGVQLAEASSSAKLLMAEITWLLQIFPSNIRPETKRENVERVWSWAEHPPEIDPSLLNDEVLGGIANAGTAYNTHRWREVVYAVELLRRWKNLDIAHQGELLKSPWEFIEWLADQKGATSRNFFHILPHLIFPEQIERISTRKDKERILEAFKADPKVHWHKVDELELNQSLLMLRQRIEAEEEKQFDFYEDDKRAIWQRAQTKDGESTTISAHDIELLRSSRRKTKYADLSEEEQQAYVRISATLKNLAYAIVKELGGDEYDAWHTSGFHLGSGVRGYIPKDLWFGVHAKENAHGWMGGPQLFMIVSERGVEFGFAPSTHPSGFSDSKLKASMRAAAPKIYSLLPNPSDQVCELLERELKKSGDWHFRTQTRLTPDQDDFPDLSSWLRYLKSPTGEKNAGGSISKYVTEVDLDGRDLLADSMEMAELFSSLMDEVKISKFDEDGPMADPTSTTFADALSAALSQLEKSRENPECRREEPLWSLMQTATASLEGLRPFPSRNDIKFKWSVGGSGRWAHVPWMAFLNENLTTSTQRGYYGVFLISNDLERVYLTLALGVTDFSTAGGAQAIRERAEELRAQVGGLAPAGFTLGDDIDLASTGRLPTNYKNGTVAFVEFSRSNLPSDLELEGYLVPLMKAYDRLIAGNTSEAADEEIEDEEGPETLEAYSIDDALEDLFMDRDEFERILSTWKLKKNLVLQGAPGVGKSFVARRLAWALIGAKDKERVEAIQFHQSYGYEDFVQGYRPNEGGGFELRNGSFYRTCADALAHPERTFVFMIDEINRGNLSKIFGELMLLMEADKRSADWAVQLAYANEGDPKFYIPENVYLIGMMNTADRSLSLVDYALRRRFAFITMDPQFASPGFRANHEQCGVPSSLTDKIVDRMNQLNDAIAADLINLGEGYRIGHSFFVPTQHIEDAAAWYRLIIETELRPLLEEYWFDDRDKANQWVGQLLAD